MRLKTRDKNYIITDGVYITTKENSNAWEVEIDRQSKQIVEFVQSKEGYEEQYFELDKITGKQKVTFIFRPGCNFDFEWFCFEQ